MDIYSPKREFKKRVIERCFLDLVSPCDETLDESIKKIEEELTETRLNFKPEPFKLHNPYREYFLLEELKSLSEIKILYAYKRFEIRLKKLLTEAYQAKNKQIDNADKIQKFLNTRKIEITDISDNDEIDDLRNVSNSIKHSIDFINDKTKDIIEFKEKAEISYTDLLQFYKRIENSPSSFIQSLSQLIIKNLYNDEIDK